MADINGETLKPSVKTQVSPLFIEATRKIKADFIESRTKNEVMTLDEMLDKVFTWEQEYGGKVQPEEVEALESLSFILGTVKFYLEHQANNEELSMRESINTQREIVKTVFNNLNEDGKPNGAITRMFGLITCVFERYFDPNDFMVEGKGVFRESGIWQGEIVAILKDPQELSRVMKENKMEFLLELFKVLKGSGEPRNQS